MANFVVFEGADGVGKTSTANLLIDRYDDMFTPLKISKRTMFSMNGESPKKLVIDDVHSLSMYLELLNNLDQDKIWVMDRSILSNLAYTCQDPVLSENALDYMCLAHKVLFVILDRDYVTEDFRDDLLAVTESEFNRTIQFYRDWTTELNNTKVYKTRLVSNGVFDNLKQDLLVDQICSLSMDYF